jgi:hypothetical protein
VAPQQPHRIPGSHEPDSIDTADVTGVTRAGGEYDEVTDLGWATEVKVRHDGRDGARGPGGPHGPGGPGPDGLRGPDGPDDPDGLDADGEARAAERSAARAAALADTEGFHPLRIRPYVTGDPADTLGGGTTARPLIDVDPDGGPATTDLSLFAAEYAADPEGLAYLPRRPEDELAALGGHGAHGRHRRRRRGVVVAAAALAASALAAGAVAMTGAVTGEEQKGERALPEPAAATPDVTLPADAAPGAAVTEPVPVTQHPMRATTAPAPRTTAPTPSASPSASASATASAPPPGSATTPSQSPTSSPTATATAPSDVLRYGDSGAAVLDLQQRLAQVWCWDRPCYRGDMDGAYDQDVVQAVGNFQSANWQLDLVQRDGWGVYGQATRAALAAATSDDGHSHHH